MTSKVVVHLTGGLGNQLFQLAAGVSLGTDEIEFETTLGKPRGSEKNTADVLAFNLPFQITLHDFNVRMRLLSQKATGFALRSATAPEGIEKSKIFSKLIEIATSGVLLLRTKKIFRIVRGSGVGYSDLPQPKENDYLIGYFQSYKFAEKSYEKLMKIEPTLIGPELESLAKLSKEESPLIVHFRLGDYLQETNFGVPGHGYYLGAIKQLWDTQRYKSIWVFSDDITSAKRMFPKQFLNYVRWIDNVDKSPASTLHAMRYGHGYVIANSTFSWWGAYLSITKEAPVIAPTPWFKEIKSPSEILPPYWESKYSDY